MPSVMVVKPNASVEAGEFGVRPGQRSSVDDDEAIDPQLVSVDQPEARLTGFAMRRRLLLRWPKLHTRLVRLPTPQNCKPCMPLPDGAINDAGLYITVPAATLPASLKHPEPVPESALAVP